MNDVKSPLYKDGENRLLGFDTAGELFIEEGKVLRGIYPEYETLYKDILKICEEHRLFTQGIVNTRECNSIPEHHKDFHLIFEHERIPFISYPHEWPASMLKDAAIFHVTLFLLLEKNGLMLKDWHPWNILFKDTNPVFVDFFSIIPRESLEKVDYLVPPRPPLFFGSFWETRTKYLFEMYRRMYVPYFLLPLHMMAQKKYKKARSLILNTTLNASTKVIRPCDVFGFNFAGRLLYGGRETAKKIVLMQKSVGEQKFLEALNSELNDLDVKAVESPYVKYYELKKENFDFLPSSGWTNKQVAVRDAIRKFRPATVLDIACNTGWFSILAAKNGCRVVAVDIDEACVDRLYEYAKTEHLSILPLVADISHSSEEIFPALPKENIYQGRMNGTSPLLLSLEKRLPCDMVLCLALVHHLVLGQNMSFTTLAKTLDTMSKKYLILEFVPQTDEMIADEPEFFPAYCSNPESFEWYTLENLARELQKTFTTIEIVNSYPDPRKLVICEK